MGSGVLDVVETTGGRVEGLSRPGHKAFYGIPYAKPPTGALRFAPPEPAEPWAGVRQAHEIGFAAPQTEHFVQGFAASGPQDEDCLNLNVFTPACDGRKRPVLFWIHGGGFTHGAGYEALYNGGPLAMRGDMVVVTCNYRLGALGFLYLPSIGAHGNMGLLDQALALAWVRDNIAAFGGDADQVTIFGESAGSASVGCQVALTQAKGLFKRAIFQSGVGRAAPAEAAEKAALALAAKLGGVEALRTASGDDIAKAQAGHGPVLAADSLPVDPAKVVKDGGASGLDILIGSNRDEVKLFVPARREEPDEASLVAQVRATLPKASDAEAADLVAVYRASRQVKNLPHSNLDIIDAVNSDARFRIPSVRLALAQGAFRPTYMFLFTHASPARRGALGACHALEMPFVFGTIGAPSQDRFAGAGPDVERLSTDMMDAWLAFARGGNPACPAVGSWDGYDARNRHTMVFDTASSRQESDPFGEERRAIEGLI